MPHSVSLGGHPELPLSAHDSAGVRVARFVRMVASVFNIGQRTAVANVFKLAGFDGRLVTAPVTNERAFLMDASALASLRDVRALEQVLQQVLGRKVVAVERTDVWGTPVPFE